MIRILVVVTVLFLTPGCAALAVGYIIGDNISRNRETATCRANLATINQARIAKGEEPFPDQCGK